MRKVLCAILLLPLALPSLRAQESPEKLGEISFRRLLDLLDSIETKIRTRVSIEDVQARLARRKPSYRVIGGSKAAKESPAEGDEAGTPGETGESKDAATSGTKQGGKHRLLGDDEKTRFPESTALVVNGRAISKTEIQELAGYYAGYLGGDPEQYYEKAIAGLVPTAAVAAKYADKLQEMGERIEALMERLAKGEDFAELAKKESEGPSKERGGDLGFFGRDQMVPPFAKVAFTLAIGQVSQPVLSPFGLHLIKVEGRQKGATPAEDKVRARHILLLFPAPPEELRRIMQKAREGRIDLALYDKSWREHLPAAYR